MKQKYALVLLAALWSSAVRASAVDRELEIEEKLNKIKKEVVEANQAFADTPKLTPQDLFEAQARRDKVMDQAIKDVDALPQEIDFPKLVLRTFILQTKVRTAGIVKTYKAILERNSSK